MPDQFVVTNKRAEVGNLQSGGDRCASINPANKEARASGGLLDIILQIGRERTRMMESLREALFQWR